MLVNVNRDQARAILCAMRQVATAGNRDHGQELHASAVASLDGCSAVNHVKAASKSRKALS